MSAGPPPPTTLILSDVLLLSSSFPAMLNTTFVQKAAMKTQAAIFGREGAAEGVGLGVLSDMCPQSKARN